MWILLLFQQLPARSPNWRNKMGGMEYVWRECAEGSGFWVKGCQALHSSRLWLLDQTVNFYCLYGSHKFYDMKRKTSRRSRWRRAICSMTFFQGPAHRVWALLAPHHTPSPWGPFCTTPLVVDNDFEMIPIRRERKVRRIQNKSPPLFIFLGNPNQKSYAASVSNFMGKLNLSRFFPEL